MLIQDNQTLTKYVPNTLKSVAGEQTLFDKILPHLIQSDRWLTQTFVSGETMQHLLATKSPTEEETLLLHHLRMAALSEIHAQLVALEDRLARDFFSTELMDTLRTANLLSQWSLLVSPAEYRRLYQRIAAIEFSFLRIGELPMPSVIDAVNFIRTAKGNAFSEWKTSDTAQLFEPHGYKNDKAKSGFWF